MDDLQPVSVYKMEAENKKAKRNAIPMTATQKKLVHTAKPPGAEKREQKKAADLAREHARIILKCKRYYEHFPETKPVRSLKSTDNLVSWQLELERIREVRASANALPQAKSGFLLSVKALNTLAQHVDPTWYIPGLEDLVAANDTLFEPELREITIEYPGLFMHGPLFRLGLKIGGFIYGIRQGMQGSATAVAASVFNEPAIKLPRKNTDTASVPRSVKKTSK